MDGSPEPSQASSAYGSGEPSYMTNFHVSIKRCFVRSLKFPRGTSVDEPFRFLTDALQGMRDFAT